MCFARSSQEITYYFKYQQSKFMERSIQKSIYFQWNCYFKYLGDFWTPGHPTQPNEKAGNVYSSYPYGAQSFQSDYSNAIERLKRCRNKRGVKGTSFILDYSCLKVARVNSRIDMYRQKPKRPSTKRIHRIVKWDFKRVVNGLSYVFQWKPMITICYFNLYLFY